MDGNFGPLHWIPLPKAGPVEFMIVYDSTEYTKMP